VIVVTAVLFFVSTKNRQAQGVRDKSIGELLSPLKHVRVWRFGLYYFLVFGGFVALAQWLVPYYLNVYGMPLATAGLMASIFSGPSGVIRAVGGWLSDKFGPRIVMLGVFVVTGVCTALLFFPKMNIESPGRGVMAAHAGTVTAVNDAEIIVDDEHYPLALRARSAEQSYVDSDNKVLPVIHVWQEPTVKIGDKVSRRQLIARGVTHIYFQANVWVFTALAFIVGIAMGIGKAAVFRYIPDYFPDSVGVVGGLVGVIGGLGGFFSPVIFGYLLDLVGLWTTTWMFLFGLTVVCSIWLAASVRQR
jgi:NNP family nitrate/nitrite transporter-like MFS transporter